MTAARDAHLLGALYWAASQLNLPTLADGGYHGAGQGIHVPYKQPGNGNVLAVDHLAFNALQRGLRALGERGFALLTRRWRGPWAGSVLVVRTPYRGPHAHVGTVDHPKYPCRPRSRPTSC